MKCLICKTFPAEKSLNAIKSNYPCFCHSCYWNEENEFDYLKEVLQKHLKGEDQMPELKFPTDEDYPDGYNWFAYDQDGCGWFYQEKPKELDIAWDNLHLTSFKMATLFFHKTPIENWKSTLRQKGQGIKHDESKTNYLQVLNKDFLPTIEECSVILEQGSRKYSPDNWKSLDPERLKKALLRHLVAYLSDEIEDKESGQKHLSHVITNCLFLNWFENQKG